MFPVIFPWEVTRQFVRERLGEPFTLKTTSLSEMLRAKSAVSITQPTRASPAQFPPTQLMFTQSATSVAVPVCTLESNRYGVLLCSSWQRMIVPVVPVLHIRRTASEQ